MPRPAGRVRPGGAAARAAGGVRASGCRGWPTRRHRRAPVAAGRAAAGRRADGRLRAFYPFARLLAGAGRGALGGAGDGVAGVAVRSAAGRPRRWRERPDAACAGCRAAGEPGGSPRGGAARRRAARVPDRPGRRGPVGPAGRGPRARAPTRRRCAGPRCWSAGRCGTTPAGGRRDRADLRREAWMRRRLARGAPRAAAGRRASIGAFHAPGACSARRPPARRGTTGGDPAARPRPDEPRGRRSSPRWCRTPSSCSTPGPAIRPASATRVAAGGRRRAAGDPAAVETAALDARRRRSARGCGPAGHPAGPGRGARGRPARHRPGPAARAARPGPGRARRGGAERARPGRAARPGPGRRRRDGAGAGRRRRGAARARHAASGLGPAVEALLAELRLPGPGDPAARAAARPAALRPRPAPRGRAAAAGGVRRAVRRARRGRRARAARRAHHPLAVQWTPGTEAMLDLAGRPRRDPRPGRRGRRCANAAARARTRPTGPTAAQIIAGLARRRGAGCPRWPASGSPRSPTAVPGRRARLAELIAALALLDRLRPGHVPGAARAGRHAGRPRRARRRRWRRPPSARSTASPAPSGPTTPRALVALAQRADARRRRAAPRPTRWRRLAARRHADDVRGRAARSRCCSASPTPAALGAAAGVLGRRAPAPTTAGGGCRAPDAGCSPSPSRCCRPATTRSTACSTGSRRCPTPTSWPGCRRCAAASRRSARPAATGCSPSSTSASATRRRRATSPTTPDALLRPAARRPGRAAARG